MRGDLERFDAVCLATTLHRMAALGAPPERCALAMERSEFARLTAAIGASAVNGQDAVPTFRFLRRWSLLHICFRYTFTCLPRLVSL